MSDKKLLIILLLLVIYIFLVKPLNSKLAIRTLELRNLERSIAKERFIEKKSTAIEKIYPKAMDNLKKNKSLFFPKNMPISAAMSYMQKTIRSVAKNAGLQIINMNWGVAEGKNGYVRLPISFSVRGYPYQIILFMDDFFSSRKKLMRFSSYFTSKYGDYMTVRAVIVGFKLKTIKQKKNTNE